MNQFMNNLLAIPVAFAQTTDKAGNITAETGNQLQGLWTNVILSIPLWITALIVMVITFILAKIVKNAIENKMTEAGMEEEHKEIQIVAGRAANAVVLILGITVALKIAGIDLTAIIAAAAFGIGFAMQDIIMNFLAGIIVLLQKQFVLGDWISVNGTVGIVKEIQSRYTVLKKFDGTKVIIPNSELFKNQVANLTGNPFRRFQLDLGIDLYLDLNEMITLVNDCIKQVPSILQSPKPRIIVTQPAAFYNNLRIMCWYESKKGSLKPMSALVKRVHEACYAKGWTWPYPTSQIIMDKDVPDNVNWRTKNYIEKHKKALEQQPQIIQQQQQILEAQHAPGQENPQPQAQQIDMGTPAMDAPVWLQKAAAGMAQVIKQNTGTGDPAQVNPLYFTPPIITANPAAMQQAAQQQPAPAVQQQPVQTEQATQPPQPIQTFQAVQPEQVLQPAITDQNQIQAPVSQPAQDPASQQPVNPLQA